MKKGTLLKTLCLILITSSLFVSGCVWQHMPPHTIDPMPIIGDLEKPDIDWSKWRRLQSEGKLTANEVELIFNARAYANYAKARDAQIDIYNGIAEAKNAAANEQKKEMQ